MAGSTVAKNQLPEIKSKVSVSSPDIKAGDEFWIEIAANNIGSPGRCQVDVNLESVEGGLDYKNSHGDKYFFTAVQPGEFLLDFVALDTKTLITGFGQQGVRVVR
jgi:hypothetical protein